MKARHIAVIDIGKTNAKLALVDTFDLSEIAVVTLPNTVLNRPPYPHFDVERIWAFLLDSLAEFHKEQGVDAISITTHGASGALIAADGSLAAPILDYEHTGPDSVAADYNALRPAFEETGSPRLPVGLNLGAQIHWQFTRDTSLRDRTKAIITYPQYWGHRLTGVLASDVSSLGCHTDLWNPYKAEFSSLTDHLEIRVKLAPARKSTDVLGSLLPDIASRTGLRPDTPVLCGIHDSNASLLTHVMRRNPPFSVVSTGTWVIVMSVGGPKVVLDATRDALVNVSGLGEPIPSARFMGGREYEIIRAGQSAICDAAVLSAVAENGPLLMPAVVPESGPFQGRVHHWIGSEPKQGTPERIAALSFYLALMTAECLSLTGHRGPIVVEGPFATNNGYCEMLRAATNWPIFVSESATGTSQGAALLSLKSDALPESVEPSPFRSANDPTHRAYAERWRRAAVI
ncbi:FGGY-family carbohydrate kinase [uncultured Ruegeria sp.]|uniref:FGGY-family carbohydrate kinase n=1 Tax=uncultured Ruegeria sp. TaxID=259304 RepID=UPI002607EB5B|nr:FGGY-family carbohydrate kinase [uncultured Ruegeria sp.]